MKHRGAWILIGLLVEVAKSQQTGDCNLALSRNYTSVGTDTINQVRPPSPPNEKRLRNASRNR